VTDPIATLGLVEATRETAVHLRAAIAELERRARIEAQRDALLRANPTVVVVHFFDLGVDVVRIWDKDKLIGSASGPPERLRSPRAR
jgi:hypothetical protein